MIILTFDDNHIAAWVDASPWMRQRGIKATFYVCYPDKYSPAEFRALRTLEEAGHEIGYHGLHHSRAALIGLPIDRTNPRLEGEKQWRNMRHYFEGEIEKGIDILSREGIRPRHFAYPYGSHSEYSDAELLTFFDTLRIGGPGRYPADRQIPRIWGGRVFGKPGADAILRGPGDFIQAIILHLPKTDRMASLEKLARDNGHEFITVSEARKLSGKGQK